jgi:predicted N-acetyltransferase YhbS
MDAIPTDMTPRPLRAEEVPLIAPLLRQTNAEVSDIELEADLRRSQASWPSLQLVVDVEGRLAGLVAGRVDSKDPTLGWSDDLVVEVDFRGRGLGDALIDAQLDAFRGLGCVRVRGLSPQSLVAQVSFFERHGFRVIAEERAHHLWGVREGETLFVTERRL